MNLLSKFVPLTLLAFIGVTLLSHAAEQSAGDPVGEALLKRMDNALYPSAYEMKLSMLTVRPGRDSLNYKYDIIGVGNDKSLMSVTAPARERGQQILMNGDNLWLYIPDISRPIKLTRKQSFMGSTFSNEDVMNTTLADDYTAKVLRRELRNGHPFYQVELDAKNNSVAYAKMIAGIDSVSAIPDTIVYYGLSGLAIKQMVCSDNKMLAGRLRPARMVMYDFLEKGAWTEVYIDSLTAKQNVPEEMFNPTHLGK